jgi:anaerobic ribonucleoside-triphosphate reductase activating protein
MKYAKIIKNDFTAGNGVCVTLYVSGCDLRCPGCHNPDLHNENYGTEFTEETINEIIEAISANGIQRNLSIMGGEPFYSGNDFALLPLVIAVKKAYPNITIFLWTGHTYESLIASPAPTPEALLNKIDYLIDGPYIQELRDTTLKMRGSKNQRILHLVEGKISN